MTTATARPAAYSLALEIAELERQLEEALRVERQAETTSRAADTRYRNAAGERDRLELARSTREGALELLLPDAEVRDRYLEGARAEVAK